jgi:hypothetical protein
MPLLYLHSFMIRELFNISLEIVCKEISLRNPARHMPRGGQLFLFIKNIIGPKIKPVPIKKTEPYTLSVREKPTPKYSITCNNVNKTPKKIVAIDP